VRAFLLAFCLVALAAACGGDGGSSSETTRDEPLTDKSFRGDVITAINTRTDFRAEIAFGLAVRVTEERGPDWLRLDIGEAYTRAKRNPDRADAIVQEVVQEARERMVNGISDASFADVEDDLLPVLKPRFAVRELEDPAERPFVAGLVVLYGVHSEDQFTLVGSDDVARWGRPIGVIDRIALANLARQTRTEEVLLCEEQLCGWASGDGYDATRMIVPALRRDIVEEIGPAVYAVPREDVFVALPVRLADRIKNRVLHDFTAAENPVSPEIFVERNGRLVALAA
jgi:uncharacterized protein YtpQ (UPF0354 family)